MSPVIGTILMVAITVMLAAGVYTWTSMFASDQETPEQASIRTIAIDVDGDGRTEWIRATLITANDAPYHMDTIEFTLMDPKGNLKDDKERDICASPDLIGSRCKDTVEDGWDIGKSLYFACQESGTHYLTLKVRTTTVIDDRATCDTTP